MATNQWAKPTMPHRFIRVWPRNSLTRVIVRCLGLSVRLPAGHRLAEFDEPVDLRDGSGDERNADHGQDQRHDDRGELHLGAPRACEGGIRHSWDVSEYKRLLSSNLISLC